MSKRIKTSVKSAVKFINNFEQTAADIASENQYEYVVCGHIHQPEIRRIKTGDTSVLYLNSGDWVENLTALEYHHGRWNLYRYEEDTHLHATIEVSAEPEEVLGTQELFRHMIAEFHLK